MKLNTLEKDQLAILVSAVTFEIARRIAPKPIVVSVAIAGIAISVKGIADAVVDIRDYIKERKEH